MQILRSHHEAAAGMALVTGDTERARDLATGLARRMETTLTVLESGEMPDNVRPHDIFQLIIESAVLGVPLTSREIRFLYAQLARARTADPGFSAAGLWAIALTLPQSRYPDDPSRLALLQGLERDVLGQGGPQ